ncbi:MAG: PEP-utilizing enzyme [Patescibacteria group bacterium]
MKKKNLKEINSIPDVSLFSISQLLQGLQGREWSRFVGTYISETYSEYKNNFLHWFVSYPLWQKFGQAVFEKIKKEESFFRFIRRKHIFTGRVVEKACDTILLSDEKKWSDARLLQTMKSLAIKFNAMNVWGIGVVAMDFENNYLTAWLERKITTALKKRTHIRITPQKAFTILTVQPKLTFSQREEMDLLRLASKKVITQHDLRKHHFHYCWVKYGYIGPEVSLTEYQNALSRLRSKGNLRHVILKLEQERKKNIILRDHLSGELRLNPEVRYLLQVSRTFMYLQLNRKELMYKTYYTFDRLLSEVGSRFGYTRQQLHNCLPKEIWNLSAHRGISKEQIRKRERLFIHRYCNGRNYLYFGSAARKLLHDIMHQEKNSMHAVDFVQGMAAYLGNVRGTVKIINTVQEIKKIKRGEILVSIATTTNILPAMRHAAAFVTDKGGITCHAAIVAREMKKPCIIGTRYATKVFKDGDRVEVDATHGIVRRLNSKS